MLLFGHDFSTTTLTHVLLTRSCSCILYYLCSLYMYRFHTISMHFWPFQHLCQVQGHSWPGVYPKLPTGGTGVFTSKAVDRCYEAEQQAVSSCGQPNSRLLPQTTGRCPQDVNMTKIELIFSIKLNIYCHYISILLSVLTAYLIYYIIQHSKKLNWIM